VLHLHEAQGERKEVLKRGKVKKQLSHVPAQDPDLQVPLVRDHRRRRDPEGRPDLIVRRHGHGRRDRRRHSVRHAHVRRRVLRVYRLKDRRVRAEN
jgi:hypothetical protein